MKQAEKKQQILSFLQKHPEWNNKHIARECACSNSYTGAVRKLAHIPLAVEPPQRKHPKREPVRALLVEHAEWNNTRIAHTIGCGTSLIRQTRKEVGVPKPAGHHTEKRQKVEALIDAYPLMGVGEISRRTGCSLSYVSRIRRGLC